MDDLLLHPRSRAALINAQQHPPHALIISGQAGSGKKYIAKRWAAQVGGICQLIVPTEKKNISISQIRDLYQATRTKHAQPQVYVLDQAHGMSAGAQNALLKLLEEPTPHTHFVLLTHETTSLLPTIRSRAQLVDILPISNSEVIEYLSAHFSLAAAALPQIAFIAGGKIGLAHRLATHADLLTTYRELAEHAKKFLSSNTYERLILQTKVSDREQALLFIDMVARMASVMLQKSTDRREQQMWVDRISVLMQASESLSRQGNLKVQLTNLALRV